MYGYILAPPFSLRAVRMFRLAAETHFISCTSSENYTHDDVLS